MAAIELAGDSPELRLELTCDDEPVVYCAECWTREFGERKAGQQRPEVSVALPTKGDTLSGAEMEPNSARRVGLAGDRSRA
jgi:hypothetical protein